MKCHFRVGAALCVAVLCGSLLAESGTSVDWSSYAGQTYTVAAGTEVTVTESEMTAFNQIGALAFADKTGKVVFDGCLTAPDVAISGAGTIEKRGDGIWALSRQLPNYTGSYVISGGFVSMLTNDVLGALSSGSSDIVVADGATLCVSNRAVYFKTRLVRFAGSGFRDSGAALAVLCTDDANSSMFQAGWSLDGDASVRVESSVNPYVKSNFKLNGHTLRKFGTGHVMHNSGKANGGAVIVEPGESDSKRTGYTLRESGVVARADPLTALYLNNFTTLRFWNNDPPQDGPLFASGNVRIQRYNQGSSSYLVETPAYNNWLGPIVMSNAATTITFTHSGGHKTNGPDFTNRFHVAGCISGPGSVVAMGPGRLYLDCPTNAWTGTTTYARNNDFSRIVLGAPGSVPDYSKFSIDGMGTRVNLASNLWTVGQIIRLLNEATFTPATTRGVAFDATCATDRTDFVVSGADVVALTNRTQILEMSEAGKTVTITGGTDVIEMPRLLVGGGTLRIAGPTTKVKLAEKTVVGAMEVDDWATLRVEDGANVEMPTGDLLASPIVLGKPDGGKVSDPKARVVVSNATLWAATWPKAYGKSATNAFNLASGTRYGLVETYDGALVSNKFVMAGAAAAVAAVHQHGGTVVAFGDYGGNLGAGTIIGYYFGHACWLIEDGLMEGLGYMCVAQNNATAVFDMRGGTYRQQSWNGRNGFYLSGSAGGCRASLVCRGNSRFYGSNIFIGTGVYAGNPASEGTLTVDENAQVSVTACYLAATEAGSRGIVNLNGGVLEASYVCGAKQNRQYDAAAWPEALAVNFNGGTLRCPQNSAIVFSYRNVPGREGNSAAPHVTVFKGGATFDIPTNVTVYVDPPLERPYGGGVERIDWTSSAYAVAPPFVRIEGDGTGASAVCDYDPKSGLVTNVTVTSRGNGYTWATAYLIMGSHKAATNATVACMITSNETESELSGGVTKTGPGTLHLAATNSWAGVTTVADGILQTDVDWALPSNACVRLTGGTLHLYGKAAYITNVVYGAGGGWIKKTENATLPETFSMEMTIDEIVAGKAIAFVGKVNVSGRPLTITGDDFSALDPTVKGGYPVVTATSELIGEPEISVAQLPPNWHFRQRGKDIRLVYRNGTMLIVK